MARLARGDPITEQQLEFLKLSDKPTCFICQRDEDVKEIGGPVEQGIPHISGQNPVYTVKCLVRIKDISVAIHWD
jgi:hypothetical protein